MRFRKLQTLVLLLFFAGSFFSVFAQSKVQKERQELEQRRRELRSQIQQINGYITQNKKKEHSVLNDVEDLDKRIRATENLIKVNNQQANLLTHRINANVNKIDKLRKQLEKLKADYAQMIRRSYKSRSEQNRIMFLLSSDNFLQAYKRIQYMKQYADYRKKQGETIKAQAEELQELNKKLVEQRKDKKKILAENRTTQAKLKKDKEQQEELIASIRGKKGGFEKELRKKQQAVSKIDAQIQAMVRESIASENKKKGASSKTKFALSPEAKALANNFTANKGKLPWPVKSGVVAMRFGTHPSPLVKTIKIKSNGVRIQTNADEPVRVVFDGKVFRIQAIKGAHKIVYVRHGDFITVYNNLASLKVETGDMVSTGQILGTVAKSTATGRPTLLFAMLKNTKWLDPSRWIYKM